MDGDAYYMIIQILIPIICFGTYPLINKLTDYIGRNPYILIYFIIGMIVCLSGFVAI